MHDHDAGLAHDLRHLMAGAADRRRALRWLTGASTLTLLGCGGGADEGSSAAAATEGASARRRASSCRSIPDETAGPYPADGSNHSGGAIANALALSGIVRRDIRSSIAGATGTAEGVPLTVELQLVDARRSCAPLQGHAVYLWQCTREGDYSMYSPSVADQNFLRGVQESDSDGRLSFVTVFPGCYEGRMPHLHVELYASANSATAFSNKLRTSQLALPVEVCREVYASSPGYESSVARLRRISFERDSAFRDGVSLQLASVTGNPATGYVARLKVGLAG
ncbi:intradiol ring-cleavage dioxygenase [Aquabacterium sp. A7-Y]|uniref:dioxygenase family protein n=1 Tax=Aquabacterium sp. A7-Y TaxID=1349605 RepID=UPI00223E11A4|nr:intradiol ring-cleavage dioxygenase [Aquabacterium sp. A7-Y]MCW7540088.1 intradiol ring-cleavage dioxygenase [Aquabacterium sp. A7-Y]